MQADLPDWQIVMSHDANLALGVGGPKGNARITVLVDSTSPDPKICAERNFRDDPAEFPYQDNSL